MRLPTKLGAWTLAWAVVAMIPTGSPAEAASGKIPILYSTDLHHPHMDPDDHFDLATLFSLAEFDVRGIVLDCGAHQLEAPGSIPLRQMLALTGRKVPFAIGLGQPLARPEDDGRGQPAPFQQGVDLVLDVLRRSPGQITVFTTGSVRDMAAAFNREPDLLRRKIARLYLNIGNPAVDAKTRRYEYNVNLDRQAYVCIMRSGLPIYWCPCFGGKLGQRGRHGTYWKFPQEQVLREAPTGLQNWFIYALSKPAGVDPVAFLTLPQSPEVRARVWRMPRNMWCTAPLLHAAGRQVYRRADDDYVALPPDRAAARGLADRRVEAYRFVPMRVSAAGGEDGTIRVAMQWDPAQPNGFVFQGTAANYDQILTSCLKNLLKEFGRTRE